MVTKKQEKKALKKTRQLEDEPLETLDELKKEDREFMKEAKSLKKLMKKIS